MLKQIGKQLSALDSQMCLPEERHQLLDQSANIHQDQAANNQQTQDRALEENIKMVESIAET